MFRAGSICSNYGYWLSLHGAVRTTASQDFVCIQRVLRGDGGDDAASVVSVVSRANLLGQKFAKVIDQPSVPHKKSFHLLHNLPRVKLVSDEIE